MDTKSVFENLIDVSSLVIYNILYGIVEKFSIIYKYVNVVIDQITLKPYVLLC